MGTIYKSIEQLPIWNYTKAAGGDLSALIIKGRVKKKVLIKQWEELIEEFTLKVGLGDEGNMLMFKSKQLLSAKLDEIIGTDTRNASKLKVKIQQLTNELTQESKRKGQSLDEQAAILEAWFKIPIDVHKVSTIRYYKYLELYQKQIEQYEKSNI